MELILSIALLAAAFYVGWNIGANDAANCIGTTVGAAVLPFRSAALMMGFFVILGGALQGEHVTNTVGKGIVITDAAEYAAIHGGPPPPAVAVYFPEGRLPDRAILITLLCSGALVTLATIAKFPVSTSQAIVGAVAGIAVSAAGFDTTILDASVVLKIAGSWVVCPLLAMVLAIGLYSVLGVFLRRARALGWLSLLRIAVVCSAAYVSYSLGANNVGVAIGPLVDVFPGQVVILSLLGGVAIAIGALTFGRRVTQTVGRDITPLDYSAALAAQLSAGFGVHAFSMLGIPVSTSHAVVGAVVGVGLTKGARAVSGIRVATIVVGWVVTPICTAAVAAGVYRMFSG